MNHFASSQYRNHKSIIDDSFNESQGYETANESSNISDESFEFDVDNSLNKFLEASCSNRTDDSQAPTDSNIIQNIETTANDQLKQPTALINQSNTNCIKLKAIQKCMKCHKELKTKEIQCIKCEMFFHKTVKCADIYSKSDELFLNECFYCKRGINLTINNCSKCGNLIYEKDLISCCKCNLYFHNLISCCEENGKIKKNKPWACNVCKEDLISKNKDLGNWISETELRFSEIKL